MEESKQTAHTPEPSERERIEDENKRLLVVQAKQMQCPVCLQKGSFAVARFEKMSDYSMDAILECQNCGYIELCKSVALQKPAND